MDQYKQLEKLLGSKYCGECGKTLFVRGNVAECKFCGMEYELKYRDAKRDKQKYNRYERAAT